MNKKNNKLCEVCQKIILYPRMGQRVCSGICGAELVRREKSSASIDRAAFIEAKKAKADANRAKRNLNKRSLGWQHDRTRRTFNRMRVLEELLWFKERNIEPYCISCLKPLGADQWCCGHFKTVGARGDLRYDRMNTYLQHNVRCNRQLSGDIGGTKTTVGYIKGIIHRFGEVEGQRILDYCDRVKSHRWSAEELEVMRKEFSRQTRILEKMLEG